MWSGAALCVIVLCCAGAVVGDHGGNYNDDQLMDELRDCITDEWLKGFLPCATQKYDDLIQVLNDSLGGLVPGAARRSRSLEPSAAHADGPGDTSILRGTYEKYLEAALDRLETVMPRDEEQRDRKLFLSRLAELDVSGVLTTYSAEVQQWLNNLHIPAVNSSVRQPHMVSMANTPTTYSNLQSVLETFAGLLKMSICSNLVGELGYQCNNVADVMSCIATYDDASLEDTTAWTQCVYQCRDLPALSTCVTEQFTTNLQCNLTSSVDLTWASHATMRLLTNMMGKENCSINIISPSLSERQSGLTLVEGSPPHTLAFSLYMPPAVYCSPDLTLSPSGIAKVIPELIRGKHGECDVSVHLATQSFVDKVASKVPTIPFILPQGGGVPTCLSGAMRRQAVLGVHAWASNETQHGGAGMIPITEDNWNDTISLPLVTTTDSKPTSDFDSALVFRLKVERHFENITRIPMAVKNADREKGGMTTCYAYGLGHMTTFRHAYYNNYYEGHFYLYKHDTLPYEVQAVYQACSVLGHGTCACAVAVLFGDDVFVVDKCRRKEPSCHRDGTDCDHEVSAILYQNGDVTPNTRIYQRDEGKTYQVILPLGTLVTIDVHDFHLNTYILPSAADLDNSKGLCDVHMYERFNPNNVTLPSGTTEYLDYMGQVFSDFVLAWRVPEESQLIQGAEASTASADSTRYCSCTHILYMGSRCTCGDAFRTETCDMNTEGDNGTLTSHPSVKQRAKETHRPDLLDVLDIDLEQVPMNLTWECVELSETEARKLCTHHLAEDHIVALCTEKIGRRFSEYTALHMDACMDDILVSDTKYELHLSALVSAVRQQCRDIVYQNADKYGIWEEIK